MRTPFLCPTANSESVCAAQRMERVYAYHIYLLEVRGVGREVRIVVEEERDEWWANARPRVAYIARLD